MRATTIPRPAPATPARPGRRTRRRPGFWLGSAAPLGAAGLLLAAALGFAPALPRPTYVLDAGSRFQIEGTSTVGTWVCAAAAGMSGDGAQTSRGVSARLAVRVQAFDCGVARMTRDFRDALGAERHPEITFVLARAASPSADARPGTWVPVTAEGRLTLAGQTRTVTISTEGQHTPDGRVRLRGRHALRMTDFGVTPPTGLGGMVRARDRVTVVFDLVASPTR